MSKLFIFLHVIAAIFWIGGMLFLSLVVAPFLQTLGDPQQKSQIYQFVGKKYRTLGWIAIITLVVTGPLILFTIWAVQPAQLLDPAFYSTGFGKAVGAKIFLVTLIVLSSLFHDFWLGPKARNSPTFSTLAKIFGRSNLIVALIIVIVAVFIRAGGF